MRPKNVGKSLAQYMPRIAKPPIKWLAAMNFSAAKVRSANWLEKKMPTIDAMANALPTQAICGPVKPSPPSATPAPI
jgi:hypothetical protein